MGTLVLTPFDWYLVGYIAAATLHDKPELPDNTRGRVAMAVGASHSHQGMPPATPLTVDTILRSNLGPEQA